NTDGGDVVPGPWFPARGFRPRRRAPGVTPVPGGTDRGRVGQRVPTSTGVLALVSLPTWNVRDVRPAIVGSTARTATHARDSETLPDRARLTLEKVRVRPSGESRPMNCLMAPSLSITVSW